MFQWSHWRSTADFVLVRSKLYINPIKSTRYVITHRKKHYLAICSTTSQNHRVPVDAGVCSVVCRVQSKPLDRMR